MRPAGAAALAVAGLGAAMLAFAAVRLIGPGGGDFSGTAYDPTMPAPAFELVDHTGRTRTMDDYRGRAVAVFFGFTSCPDVCPLTLNKLERVLDTMGADTSDVVVLLVTVDPERDTPAALASYVERFDPYVIGLTGDEAALAELRAAYGVYAGDHPSEHGPSLTHTPAVFGVDRNADVRVLLPMEREDDIIARDIRRLIR